VAPNVAVAGCPHLKLVSLGELGAARKPRAEWRVCCLHSWVAPLRGWVAPCENSHRLDRWLAYNVGMNRKPPLARCARHFVATSLALALFLAGLASATAEGNDPKSQVGFIGGHFDGARAFSYLREICSYGNRKSGSEGMRQQQVLLEEHFTKLGGKVVFQDVPARDPLTGQPVSMKNLIVEWHPDRKNRILLCAHYDTRPLPDRDPDPRNRLHGVFLGANDGASGVSVLMELAHHVEHFPEDYGVDFVFFDGEELVYDDRRDPYFIGSTWFARDYRDNPPEHQYAFGVLLDMVGDAKLSVYQEHNSMSWEETRPIVREIWATAAKLGVDEFIPRVMYAVDDDHIPLYRIGGIPVCNVIDFHFPDRSNRFWHTTSDTPNRCSADSLGKVGKVILEWLGNQEIAEQ